MAGRYTVADLDKAYENRKKNNENNSTQRNTSRSNVSSSSADRVNNYTVADLEQAYQRQYGQNVSQQQTQTRVPFADHTKTAQEIAADKLREYSSREPVEQFDTMNPDSEQMRAFRSARMSADPTRTSTSTPKSPWLIKQMDDEAINEAINLLTQRRAQTENEYMNTWDTNENAQSLLDQMDEDAEIIERYKEELETREATRQSEEIEAYQQKRTDSLDELPEEAVELLNQYNQSIQNRESLQMTGTVTGYVDPMEIVRYDTAIQDARDKLINEYGVAESDIGRLAQYEKELSDEENTQNMRQQIREDVAEHPVGYGALYTGMDIIMSPLTGLAATTESIKSRYYADQDAPVNTNSGAYAALNFSNATEQSVNEEIDNPVGQFAYNVATSTAKSAFSAAIGGQVTKTLGLTGKAAEVVGNAVTLPQFGATAYASTLQEDQERGISTENATKHAVAAGIGEMMFEIVSLDKVWEIAGRSGRVTAQQVIRDSLVQAGIEGTEEGMTDLWDRVADDIINGDQSAYNTNVQNYMQLGYSEEEARAQASKDFYSEVVQDVLAGMASGGLSSGGANTIAAVNYHNLGNYVDSNSEIKQTVYDAAQNMDASSSARQIVQDKSVEDLSASDMADLLYTMSQETEMDTAKVLEDAFVARGESRTQAKKDAQTVLEAVSTPSEDVSEEESDARAAQFAANENLAEVYAETLKGEHTRAQDAIRTAQESYETSKYYDKLVRQGKTSQTGVAKATIKDTGTDAIVIELADVSGGKAVVRMSDNTYKNLDDIEIQDGIKQSLYNFATTMDTAQAGNAIIENYAGESLPSYMEACAVFYNAGKLGSTSFDGMMSNPKNSKLVSNMSNPATLKTMYMLGENSRSAKKDKVAPVQQKKNSKTEQNKKTAETRKEGKVIDNRTNKSDNRIVEIAVQVAKKTGLEITLNDNLEHGENGHFQKALSRIALSSTSKNEYATLVHELNEFAESYNPEGMKKVIDKVLDYAQTQEGAAFLFGKESGFVQRYQNAYKRVEADKTYEDAAEEFVFDYLSGVFSSKEGVEDFSRYMTETGVTHKEQKGILETIADFFKELVDKINSYLDEHVLSSAAKKGLQADAKKASEIRQMVMEVWQQAEETYQNKNAITDATDTTDTRFSLSKEEYSEYEKTEDEGLYEFAKASLEGRNAKKAYFKISSKIDERLANDIERITGVNVNGYGNEISDNGIKHIEKEHGREGRTDHSMEDLHDLARISYAINGYEKIREGKHSKEYHCNTIELQKKLGERYYYVVEAAPNAKNKTLHVISAYINKNDTFSGVAVSNDPSRYVHDEPQSNESFSNNIIPRTTENATKNYSINVTEMTSEDDSMLKEHFGTTKNYNMAGYILKDGSMLDFSGRHWGDTSSRVRQVDHRDINEVLDEENYGDAMINAIANGNIRLMSETGGINLAVTPTRKQEDVLRGYILSFHGAVIVDFDEKGGDTVKSLVYDRGTEADDVLDDIYNYFRGGTQSELMRFHAQYSIEVDEDGIENYITSEETKALSYKERQKKLLDIMRNEYAGRTAKFEKKGQVYYALYNDARITKGVYGDKKSDERGRKAKLNIGADGNYIELAENALYQGTSREQGKRNKFHKDAKTWDYYVKTIKSDGRYFDVLINVKDTGSNQYVYDITLQEQKKKPSALVNSQMGDLALGGTAPIDSIPQNSQNATKKYSIDIDDSLFDALQDTYSAQEQEVASIVQEGFAALKNVTVNEKVMHKVAYDIKKEYKSKYDIKKLQENLTRVFAYLKDNADTVGYEDMVRIVQEIAKPVIQESTDIDSFEKEIYDNFRNHLRSYTIRLSEEQKAEVAYYYGSYENFRKKNFGNLNISDKGTYLDNIWSEICDHSYEMLDRSVSTADEPIALIDALNALRPVKKNIYGMDTEQASYDLALDIYRRFFVEQGETRANQKIYEKTQRLIVQQQEYRKRVKGEYDASLQRLREVEQQKRKNLAEKYEQKIADLKENQKAMLAYKDVKAHNAAQRQMDWYTAALAKTNQKANDRILEIRASNRQSMINKRRNEEIRQCRERIKKNAQGIVNMFNTNTDKKHVPEVLKEPVARFITSIDFVSERANPDSAATLSWQDALNQMYRKLSDRKSAVDGGYIELYDALHDWENGDKKTSTILSDMAAFIDSNSGVKVSEMNIEQLKQLDEMITGLKRTIASVNQLYVNKRTKNVQELANGTIGDLSDKKSKKSRSKIGEMAENLLDVDMLDARSYFYRLGDNAYSIYEELRTAFSDRVWLLKEAQTYMERTLDGINVKDWTGDKAKVHTFMIGGQELKMTTGQIMSLYELKNRYQAKAHLRHGGIRPTKIGRGKKGIERVTPVKLTDYEVDLICQALTPEQRKVADAMQQFLANNCADWGNKASMMMYGYERFGAANYFPIKTDGNSVDTRDDTKFFATKNQGFTKETMKNASNALMVDDIFDVFTKHVTDMASYSTFTAPLMDAMKWFNHRSMDYEGDVAIYGPSVKQEIDRVYGNQYLEYFKKLIQDINAETTKGIESQISDTLTSRVKAASVGANLRVAIQQPTAYVRAMAVMNPKYLLKAVPHKSQIKKAKENSAISQWKSWGYFETSIGRSMKNVITGQDSFKNKLVEKSMTLAQIGDDLTWGYLWNACEAEIKEKHSDVTYDSEEFLKLVSERFDEVVDQTQVVDTVLHRSHIMRSENGIVKMATSFMAEPTKSYNMLMTQIRDISEGGGTAAKKRFARSTIAYVANGILNAFAVSLIDAMRDDDDDDSTFGEKYWEAWRENVIDNLNPLGMIPYVKDILSIFNGYDVARMDMQGLSNLITGGQLVWKYINDSEYREKHTLLDASKMLIQGASQVLGLPLYNCLRDFEAIFNTITGEHLGGIKRDNTRNYERMTDALLEGDTEKYEDALGELEEKEIETKNIESGVRNEVKDRYLIGEISKEDAEDILREAGGLDANETYWKIRDWEYRANNPDASSSDYKYLYDAMDNAFESGKIDDRDAMVEEISLLLNHGKTTETVMRQVTDHYKPIYLELKAAGSYADMKNLLISAYMMLGLSKSEAMEKIEGWEEEK